MAENSTLESTRPDASSFVEHLRLVHFTLIAASLITMIAITSQEKSSAARAYEQTKDLIKASSRWHFGQWVSDLIVQKRPGILQSKGTVERDEVSVDVIAPSKSGDVTEFLSHFRMSASLSDRFSGGWRLTDIGSASTGKSIGRDFHVADNDDNSKRERPPDFNNLGGAITIWDYLHRFQYLVFVKKLKTGWYVLRNHGHADVLSVTANEEPTGSPQDSRTKITLGNPGLLLRQDLVDFLARGPWLYGEPRLATVGQTSDPYVDDYNTLSKLVLDDKDTSCYFFDRDHLILLRAECVFEYFPLQLALVDGLIPTTSLGEFSRSFPDIDELAKHLRALSLEDLQTFFLAEKNRAGDQVELPGVKVPGEAVTSWGTAILAAWLCYFGVVLREFSLRVASNDKAWEVPWIGTSSDFLSRAAFLVSILFVLFALGYLAINGVLQNSAIIARIGYLLAPVVAAAAVSFLILFAWRRLLRQRSSTA